MVRSRITLPTALLAIINKSKLFVVTWSSLILLCVCTGAAVFVFDLPKMHVSSCDVAYLDAGLAT